MRETYVREKGQFNCLIDKLNDDTSRTGFYLVKLFIHPASSINEKGKLFKTTRWAVKNLTWVDETRIGVMGTNYGGFLALLTDR